MIRRRGFQVSIGSQEGAIFSYSWLTNVAGIMKGSVVLQYNLAAINTDINHNLYTCGTPPGPVQFGCQQLIHNEYSGPIHKIIELE